MHYHLLLADGVFVRTRARAGQPARVKFLPAAPLKPHDVPEVLAHVESRVMKLLKHRGMLQETADGQPPPDEFARKNPAMAAILQASLFDRSVLDPDRSVPPLRERGVKPDDVEWRKRNCTAHNQFTLHANSRIAPLDRKGLEKMICYLCRPALATDRVELLETDTIVRLRLKSAWRDGTTHLRMPAAEFVLRLLALIPAPRKKQFRYLGVFCCECVLAAGCGAATQAAQSGERARKNRLLLARPAQAQARRSAARPSRLSPHLGVSDAKDVQNRYLTLRSLWRAARSHRDDSVGRDRDEDPSAPEAAGGRGGIPADPGAAVG